MEKTPDQNIEDISNKILLTAYNQYRKNIDRVIQYNKKCRVRQKRNYQNYRRIAYPTEVHERHSQSEIPDRQKSGYLC